MSNHICPNCGYCPSCGRSNAPPVVIIPARGLPAVPAAPVYPVFPVPQTYPVGDFPEAEPLITWNAPRTTISS